MALEITLNIYIYIWVFNERLKVSGDEHRRIASGKVFQAGGPATAKARSASVERRVAGTVKSAEESERRRRRNSMYAQNNVQNQRRTRNFWLQCTTAPGLRVYVFAWLMFIIVFPLLTYRFKDYYFVCAIGGQHDGHLPFWLTGFVKLIML